MKEEKRVDWTKVRGQEFTHQEATEAADFADLIESYGVRALDLKEFIDVKELKVGDRLALAELLPVEDLGVVIMAEEDDRVMRVAKQRCEDERIKANGGLIV